MKVLGGEDAAGVQLQRSGGGRVSHKRKTAYIRLVENGDKTNGQAKLPIGF